MVKVEALVRPIMEYACVVWDPITQKNITELERVQRKAGRFVMGDYKTTSSVRSMLEHLEWPTLRLVLKASSVDAETASAGSSFHSLMVGGKNDWSGIQYHRRTSLNWRGYNERQRDL
jgi:hypothetical protein